MAEQMDMQQIDGADVFRWFVSGAREVAAHMKYLNIINVFPVADGDTGTNLTATLRAMVEKPMQTPSFNKMLQQFSQSALESARGNSGIIFASYINGLAMESTPYDKVGVKEFATVASGAVRHLYNAVEYPREGTIMSVIRDWAEFLNRNTERFRGFPELFEAAYHVATEALEKTKTQLAVLRKNNVVDSGAAGFVRFLEGINRAFGEGRSQDVIEDFTPATFVPDTEATEYRYCTEALLDTAANLATNDVIASIKPILHPLGDSLIITPRDHRLKIHIHTNHPELVMSRLRPYGTILEQKADDMALQNRLRLLPKGGVGLITDSIADLPDSFLLEHAISVVPLGVIVQETPYLDKITMNLPQLFAEMENRDGYPTSSQPEPARIRALLSARMEQFDSLVVLSVSNQLSGTCHALTQAAQALSTPEKPITVIDTRLNSGAQGLLVKRAADLIAAGSTHEQIVRDITSRIPRTKIYVCLHTLAYAVRGGRVPNTVGKLGMKVGLRPIMTLDARGRGAAFGMAFSQQGLTRKILRLVRKAIARGGIDAYSIVHGQNPSLAADYAAQLTALIGQPPEFVAEISAAVALHAGSGTVAVCFTERKRDAR